MQRLQKGMTPEIRLRAEMKYNKNSNKVPIVVNLATVENYCTVFNCWHIHHFTVLS